MLTEQERQFLDLIAKSPIPTDVPGLRAALDTFGGMLNANPPAVGAFHEAVELRPGLRADIAVPKGKGPFPVLVYIHGGGWVAGSPATHRKLGLQFADAGTLVINVDYRLAPEHPFPAGLEDCVFAVKWAGANASKFGGDGSRIAVGGDSAGGNLTAATLTSLAAESYAGPKPRAALLIYGVYDFPATLKRSGDLGVDGMARAYAGAGYPGNLEDPRISPLRAVKSGSLPRSLLVCGTADVLLPETHSMAAALKRADIPHEVAIFEDMPHGFVQMDMLSGGRESVAKMIDFLRRAL